MGGKKHHVNIFFFNYHHHVYKVENYNKAQTFEYTSVYYEEEISDPDLDFRLQNLANIPTDEKTILDKFF